MIESTKPDIVIGCESWLDNSISSTEVFPSDYKAYRKDRRDGSHGGVFTLVQTNFKVMSQRNSKSTLDVNYNGFALKLLGQAIFMLDPSTVPQTRLTLTICPI